MRTKILHLDNFTDSLASLNCYDEFDVDDNRSIREKMIKTLFNAIDGELTQRQKECLLLHYNDNMSITKIAETLNIGVSSVSRHITKSEERLKKVMGYYFILDDKVRNKKMESNKKRSTSFYFLQ